MIRIVISFEEPHQNVKVEFPNDLRMRRGFLKDMDIPMSGSIQEDWLNIWTQLTKNWPGIVGVYVRVIGTVIQNLPANTPEENEKFVRNIFDNPDREDPT